MLKDSTKRESDSLSKGSCSLDFILESKATAAFLLKFYIIFSLQALGNKIRGIPKRTGVIFASEVLLCIFRSDSDGFPIKLCQGEATKMFIVGLAVIL